MAGAATALSIVGTIIGVAGSLIAASGQRKVAEFNAQRQEEEARRERSAGAIRGKLEQRRARELASRAKAAQAASGAITTEGTSLLVLEEIQEEGEYQARVQETNSAQRARGLENSAIASRFEGKVASQAAVFNAGASLIGGFGKIASGKGFKFG